MGGYFAVASRNDCVFDLFFGTDYHCHLGTRRGGMAVYGEKGFQRAIHNIENSPFRTKFEKDVETMAGSMGVGCISDTEPQPLLVRSHLGNYAITTVGRINNLEELASRAFNEGGTHFLEMSGGSINPTELTAVLINRKDTIAEGIRYAQSLIEGSLSVLVLTSEGIYAARDRLGRTPMVVGKKEGGYCVSFESSAYINLGYDDFQELGPGEVVRVTPEAAITLLPPLNEMKMCTFLWVYYGYPSSSYEGTNVETMRYRCGDMLARRDDVQADSVAGVPDSGTPHAVGYANQSGIPFSRPFVKYTPSWPRSFMSGKNLRSLTARMKLIPVEPLIRDKRLVLIDDSIVRGNQLGETTEYLHHCGAREVHVRPACPPVMFGCKYLNFSRSPSAQDLIARRVITRLENGDPAREKLDVYAQPDSPEHARMTEEIRKELNFTTLKYQRLDDMLAATGLSPCKLCTYCWNGKE